MEINERIFYLLNTQKKTAKDLGAFIKINPSSISGWKNEGSYPSSKLIVGISEFFDVSLNYLLTGAEPSNEIIVSEDSNLTINEKYSVLPTRDKSEINDLIDIKYQRAFPQNTPSRSTCLSGKKRTGTRSKIS